MQNLEETLRALGIDSELKTYKLGADTSCYLIELESANLLKLWDRIRKRTASFGWQPVIIGAKDDLDEILQFTGPDSGWFSKRMPDSHPEQPSGELLDLPVESATDVNERRAAWAQFENSSIEDRKKWAADQSAEIDKLEKSPSDIRRMLAENLEKPQEENNPFGHFLGGAMGSKVQELLGQASDNDLTRAYQHTLDNMRDMFSFVANMPDLQASLQKLHEFENPHGIPETLEDAIRLSALIDPEDWFKEKCKMESRFERVKLGPWPDNPYRSKLQFSTIDSGAAPKKVAVVIIPAKESWDVPCVVNYGGWNACPPAQIQTTVLRRWNRLYGATLVSMSRDTIGLYLSKPISTREEAVKVAREQYIFCNDLVDQGTGELNDLASRVLDANFWNFWWD